MNTKLLSILLAVSLGFNVFCAIGSFQAKRRKQQAHSQAKERRQLAHSPQARMERFAKKLNLNEEQYERFQQRRQSMGPKRQAFLAELIKEEPDQKLLESFALERIVLMQEFMRDLSPEQKQKFVEIINKRFSTSRETTAPPAK